MLYRQTINTPNSSTAVLTNGIGLAFTYANKNASTGVYTAPPGAPNKLVQNANGTWTETAPDGSVLNYNTGGNLATLQRSSNIWTLGYDPGGRIQYLLDPVGTSYFGPHHDGALSRWMQWLLTSHVRRYHRHYHCSGPVWRGRFQVFPIEQDEHLLALVELECPPFSSYCGRGMGGVAGVTAGGSGVTTGAAGAAGAAGPAGPINGIEVGPPAMTARLGGVPRKRSVL